MMRIATYSNMATYIPCSPGSSFWSSGVYLVLVRMTRPVLTMTQYDIVPINGEAGLALKKSLPLPLHSAQLRPPRVMDDYWDHLWYAISRNVPSFPYFPSFLLFSLFFVAVCSVQCTHSFQKGIVVVVGRMACCIAVTYLHVLLPSFGNEVAIE